MPADGSTAQLLVKVTISQAC